jgi:hypothetical protein
MNGRMRRERGASKESSIAEPGETMKFEPRYVRLHKDIEMQEKARILNSFLTSGDLEMMKTRERHVIRLASGERTYGKI